MSRLKYSGSYIFRGALLGATQFWRVSRVFSMNDLREVTFRFYGDLKRFLPQGKRTGAFTYAVKGSPAVKDTIEALGVPHGEVDGLVINGRSVGFYEPVKGNDTIAVYPDSSKIRLRKIKRLKPKLPANPKFILDVHLGKLTRHLRLLGFDCLYQRSYKDQDIVETTLSQRRIVLTRDVGLLKNKLIKFGYFIRHTEPDKQIREVITKFSLSFKTKPFHRCLECNGLIRRISFLRVINHLPPKVSKYYKEFVTCRICGRVYWKGSHYKQLLKVVKRISV